VNTDYEFGQVRSQTHEILNNFNTDLCLALLKSELGRATVKFTGRHGKCTVTI